MRVFLLVALLTLFAMPATAQWNSSPDGSGTNVTTIASGARAWFEIPAASNFPSPWIRFSSTSGTTCTLDTDADTTAVADTGISIKIVFGGQGDIPTGVGDMQRGPSLTYDAGIPGFGLNLYELPQGFYKVQIEITGSARALVVCQGN